MSSPKAPMRIQSRSQRRPEAAVDWPGAAATWQSATWMFMVISLPEARKSPAADRVEMARDEDEPARDEAKAPGTSGGRAGTSGEAAWRLSISPGLTYAAVAIGT